MSIADGLAYFAPLLPFVTAIWNDRKKWRKEHKERSNLLLTLGALFVAWAMIFSSNSQHRRETEQAQRESMKQSQALSELKIQNQSLIAQKSKPHYSKPRLTE